MTDDTGKRSAEPEAKSEPVGEPYTFRYLARKYDLSTAEALRITARAGSNRAMANALARKAKRR
jgi:hypothetical protein